jgi:signal-transduction protein with cAMP-binding, CBS, and nucleotidyltransferase domain
MTPIKPRPSPARQGRRGAEIKVCWNLDGTRRINQFLANPTNQAMEIHGTVWDILQNKGGEIWTTSLQSTVYDAIGLMGEKNIGALVAVDGDEVVGVLSERDYSRKVVLQGRTSRDTLVGDILTRPAITVNCRDSIETCMQLMTSRRIRHLPVVEDGRLVGLVSMGDLVNWAMQSQRHTILQLQGYISGDYPG